MGKNDLYFSWSYPAEKFGAAVDVLARSFAPGWQRMLWAIQSISYMRPEHFPDRDLYERLENLLEQVRAYGPLTIAGRNVYGSFENTLRRRKRATLERYADEIVNVFEEIERRRGQYQE